MYPREYFDTFWRPGLRDEVFVAMQFKDFDDIWKDILKPAIEKAGLKPHRVDARRVSGNIITEIMDGIAHARLILGDVSPVAGDSPNANVMYEIGLAHALRQSCEVLLVSRDRIPHLFDIGAIRVHAYYPKKPHYCKTEIAGLVVSCLKEIDTIKSLKVEMAINSLDDGCLRIMASNARLQYFAEIDKDAIRKILKTQNAPQWALEMSEAYDPTLGGKASIGRLLDLRIIRCDANAETSQYAYHWTDFGGAVLRKMGFRK